MLRDISSGLPTKNAVYYININTQLIDKFVL